MLPNSSKSFAEAGHRVEALNRLAFPKGKLPVCELTGLPAAVQCVCPHITLYYATEEHAEQAWHGIMYKIAPLIGSLRAAPPIIGSEDERQRRENTILVRTVAGVFVVLLILDSVN
jgi:hypothetical protein